MTCPRRIHELILNSRAHPCSAAIPVEMGACQRDHECCLASQSRSMTSSTKNARDGESNSRVFVILVPNLKWPLNDGCASAIESRGAEVEAITDRETNSFLIAFRSWLVHQSSPYPPEAVNCTFLSLGKEEEDMSCFKQINLGAYHHIVVTDHFSRNAINDRLLGVAEISDCWKWFQTLRRARVFEITSLEHFCGWIVCWGPVCSRFVC